MDRIVERLGDRLAARTSRRSFLARLGQAALALGAVAAGVGSTVAMATGYCCSGTVPMCGTPCPSPPSDCPCGLTEDFNHATCCKVGSQLYECIPCRNPNNTLNCYASGAIAGTTCPVGPPP